MNIKFWLDVWDNNEIGFDQKAVNPLLASHIKSLDLASEDSIFVPLCGKSIDMIWLLKQGYKVVGVELSEAAIEQSVVPTPTKQLDPSIDQRSLNILKQ